MNRIIGTPTFSPHIRRTHVATGDEENRRLRRTIDASGKYSIQANTNEEVFPTSQRMGYREKSPNDFVESKMENGYYVEFYNNRTNASTHTFTLDNLRHFSMYSISVQACRDFNDSSFNVNTYCSNVVLLNRRTTKIGLFFNLRCFVGSIVTKKSPTRIQVYQW